MILVMPSENTGYPHYFRIWIGYIFDIQSYFTGDAVMHQLKCRHNLRRGVWGPQRNTI
jgi:hypothetical protein